MPVTRKTLQHRLYDLESKYKKTKHISFYWRMVELRHILGMLGKDNKVKS